MYAYSSLHSCTSTILNHACTRTLYFIQDHRVYAVLRDGVIVVGVIGGGGSHVMQAGLELVALTQWNYIIIQLE